MKITFLINDISIMGGAERVTTDIVNTILNKTDINIDIICQTMENKESFYKINEKVNIINFNNKVFDHSKKNIIAHYFKVIGKLIKDIKDIKEYTRKSKPDIIVGVGYYCSIVAGIPKLNGVDVIAWEHIHYNSPGILWRSIRRVVYKKVKGVIAITKEDRKMYSNYFKNSFFIPNPVTFDIDRKSELTNKKIIAVGRLDNQKGFDMLIKAGKIVIEKYPEWEIDIYGNGPQEMLLKELIRDLKVEKNIYLKGIEKNIKNKYLESSIFVLSSRYEGFSLVIVEAMSCGVPVVSFDCKNGPGELIENNKTGILVKEDIFGLAEKIIELIENIGKRENLRENAIIFIKNYSKDKIILRWLELFKLWGKNFNEF